MTTAIQAIDENGVFKPKEPLHLFDRRYTRICSRPLFAVVVWLLLSLQASLSAQVDQDYFTLTERYHAGDIQGAVTSLAMWREDRVRAAVQTIHANRGNVDVRAVVMLHSDVAFTVSNDRLAAFHIDLAQSLLPTTNSDDRTFAARWHGWAAILYAMRDNQVQARRHISLGIASDEKNTDVQIARGVLEELSVRRVEHNLRGDWIAAGAQARWETRLNAAAIAYGTALDNDARCLEARLRLGWVLFLNHSSEHAREQLQMVTASATRADLQYLAHLFLGAVFERDKEIDAAAREYESAHAIAPHQASFVGLIRIAVLTGKDNEAQTLAVQFASRVRNGDEVDPWQSYNLGMTSSELIDWLHRQASIR